MTTHVVADDVLGRIARKQWELTRRVLEGTLDAQEVSRALQSIIEGRLSQDARFHGKLLTLAQQLERLKYYSSRYWDDRLSVEQIDFARPPLNHAQRIDDLAVFHVQFDSLEETAEMWWRVMVGEQPDNSRWGDLELDAKNLRLIGSNVATYDPGIHVVRINLVAHWAPVGGRTLEEVRAQAKESGETLAQLEVMSAYGLHAELMREQDGENLPYPEMGGTAISVPARASRRSLFVYWHRLDRKVALGAGSLGSFCRWAAPVILES
jgi:hypothetical protein